MLGLRAGPPCWDSVLSPLDGGPTASHRAGAWLVRGKLVLNTGSFTLPGQPHVVTVSDDSISLTPLTRVAGEWRQDASARRTWVIDEIARSTAAPSTPVS